MKIEIELELRPLKPNGEREVCFSMAPIAAALPDTPRLVWIHPEDSGRLMVFEMAPPTQE